jgi:hypothetical protein
MYRFMEFLHEISWNCMEFHSLYKFHRIPKKFLEIQGNFFFFPMEFRGLSIG